jgi:YbbR domain-containing protein
MIAFLRNLFFGDLALKLFSLVIALLIWLVVDVAIRRQVSPTDSLKLLHVERTLTHLPVVVMSSAEDVRSFQVDPKEVDVTVRGDPKVVQDLRSQDIRVIVDLTGIEAAHELAKRIEVSTPAGVTFSRVVPDQVKVVFPAKP